MLACLWAYHSKVVTGRLRTKNKTYNLHINSGWMTPYLVVWQSMVAMATYCINIQCTLCLVEPAQMALMCKTYKWALNPMHSHLVFGMTVIQSLRGCLNVSEIGTWKTITQKFEVRISEEIRHIYCLWHFFIMLCICRQQQSCGIALCIC